MTQFLPPNLLALFAPRDPIPYAAPIDRLPWEKKSTPYKGIAQFVNAFEDPTETPAATRSETKDERKERKKKERAEMVAYKLEQDLALWEPSNDPNCASDPYKSLFIARINYDTSESKLRREFEAYGPVKRVHLVHNVKNGKPRGYAFVEFEHERDMHSAYKHADGKKIDGRRVLVDVERSRTVKGWRPRRLGGGLGGTRLGPPEMNTKYSGRDEGRRERSRSPERTRRRSRERGGGPGALGGGGDRDRRDRDRRRSRSRDRKRRSRSRERGRRDRGDRGERDRNRGGGEVEVKQEPEANGEEGSRRKEKRSRRSRSRERRRSRSRDRKRSRRSRSREKKRSRSRDRKRDEEQPVEVKEERHDPGYDKYATDPNQQDTKPVISAQGDSMQFEEGEPPAMPAGPEGVAVPITEFTSEGQTYQQ